ncbi:hypothetical protein L3Q82_002384 [Scortum barcoo]|uniref:Uncharacterized protein n=1 Tax=Scortum barcoo TaxID=214431 RepID=A0ACB8W131_9TELE|nr:hypothetical protein L3Q82_002384 [Scortum barcoo]
METLKGVRGRKDVKRANVNGFVFSTCFLDFSLSGLLFELRVCVSEAVPSCQSVMPHSTKDMSQVVASGPLENDADRLNVETGSQLEPRNDQQHASSVTCVSLSIQRCHLPCAPRSVSVCDRTRLVAAGSKGVQTSQTLALLCWRLSPWRHAGSARPCSSVFRKMEAEPAMTFPESTLVQAESRPYTNTTDFGAGTDDIIDYVKMLTSLWH